MFEVCTNQHDEDTKICPRDARRNGEFTVQLPPAARARGATLPLPSAALTRREYPSVDVVQPRSHHHAAPANSVHPDLLAKTSSCSERRGCSRSHVARTGTTRVRVLGLGFFRDLQWLSHPIVSSAVQRRSSKDWYDHDSGVDEPHCSRSHRRTFVFMLPLARRD